MLDELDELAVASRARPRRPRGRRRRRTPASASSRVRSSSSSSTRGPSRSSASSPLRRPRPPERLQRVAQAALDGRQEQLLLRPEQPEQVWLRDPGAARDVLRGRAVQAGRANSRCAAATICSRRSAALIRVVVLTAKEVSTHLLRCQTPAGRITRTGERASPNRRRQFVHACGDLSAALLRPRGRACYALATTALTLFEQPGLGLSHLYYLPIAPRRARDRLEIGAAAGAPRRLALRRLARAESRPVGAQPAHGGDADPARAATSRPAR